MPPRLTIGLPVYNGERYLSQAIETLLAQTFRDFELIIADNASTDRTQTICEQYQAEDRRIRYIRNAENVGAAKNFNNVYALANGEYFKWAACDDLIDERFLEECIQVLDRDPSVILAYSLATKIDEDGRRTGTYDYPMRVDSPLPHLRFHDLIMVNHFCIAIFGVMRTAALKNTPLIGAFVGSDRTLLAELGLKGRLCEVQAYLFHRRDHPQASGRMYKVYDRRSWFDPSKRNAFVFPYWYVGLTYIRSVLRTPLSAVEKLRSIGVAFSWFLKRRKFLLEDIKAFILYAFPSSRQLSNSIKTFTGKKKRGGLL
ncbi:MAG TPA: glycosyltransferase family 2 protein [Anaerolineaceae bacterium]|nr:glycosyltransferase family 2 protein [Anaerolineaceae bacterium]